MTREHLPHACAAIALIAALGATSPAEARLPPRPDAQHFSVDPVADGTLIGAGFGFTLMTDLILSTGEIVPQRPGPTSNLLGIDRWAVDQTVDRHASRNSNIGLYGAVAFAILDPVVSGWRSGLDSGLVDAVIYGESISLTLTITNLTKIAVRRPRPIAYIEQRQLDQQSGGTITTTDATLSFFSGHSSTVAAISASATYLTFMRYPRTIRPWITMGLGMALTTFVAVERVRAGAHFPTDVIAGAMAGASVGVLVPHLHRSNPETRTIWFGLAPTSSSGHDGVTVNLHARF